jgi:hypothetical protein
MSYPGRNARQSHSWHSFCTVAFQTRVAAMESQASLAVGLSAKEATISDGTEARRASSASRSSWNSTSPNSTASQSCRAYNFTFISRLKSL